MQASECVADDDFRYVPDLDLQLLQREFAEVASKQAKEAALAAVTAKKGPPAAGAGAAAGTGAAPAAATPSAAAARTAAKHTG